MKFSSLTLFSLLITFSVAAQTPEERLLELVQINSGSANIRGVLNVQKTAKMWLEEAGFKTQLIQNPEGEAVSAPLLVAEMEGVSAETITFIMHADTVFEPSSPFQKASRDGDKLIGPGVMDDKGGLIVLLEAMKDYLKEGAKPKFSLRVLVSPNEEVGSIGWSKVFHDYAQKSWLVLGLEPGHDHGGIVHGRKGNVWYEIKVTGKEAHAGRDHKLGINACAILAEKITQLTKITNYQKGVTLSTGRIQGGQDKYNIVCGWAEAKVDIRVPDLGLLKSTKAKVEGLLKHPQISWKITDETPPFNVNNVSKPVIQKYLKAIEKIEGRKVHSESSGGVGDTNHFSREGIIILDGLGPIGGNAHTEQEFIDLKTIPTRARILSEFLKSL